MLTSLSSRLHCPVRLNRMGKGVAYFGLTALLALTAATAQVAPLNSTGLDASGNPRSEMATCQSGSTQQDGSACAKEVRNANAEKREGKLDTGADFMANAKKRCEVFTEGADKAACLSRVESEAKLDGSVAGGGVLRQQETTVPATAK
ncbi:MAG: hypothetical protein JWR68_2643 [Polaromonas sp.]|nr:hypothetical protein [Polaromonas sp.]